MQEFIIEIEKQMHTKSKDEYIKFLVGAYLQEVYVLEQRLSAYAKKTSRLYKKN